MNSSAQEDTRSSSSPTKSDIPLISKLRTSSLDAPSGWNEGSNETTKTYLPIQAMMLFHACLFAIGFSHPFEIKAENYYQSLVLALFVVSTFVAFVVSTFRMILVGDRFTRLQMALLLISPSTFLFSSSSSIILYLALVAFFSQGSIWQENPTDMECTRLLNKAKISPMKEISSPPNTSIILFDMEILPTSDDCEEEANKTMRIYLPILAMMSFYLSLFATEFSHRFGISTEIYHPSLLLALFAVLAFIAFVVSTFLMILVGARFTRMQIAALLISPSTILFSSSNSIILVLSYLAMIALLSTGSFWGAKIKPRIGNCFML